MSGFSSWQETAIPAAITIKSSDLSLVNVDFLIAGANIQLLGESLWVLTEKGGIRNSGVIFYFYITMKYYFCKSLDEL